MNLKKAIFLIFISLTIFTCLNTSMAFLFDSGETTIECDDFSVTVPEGFRDGQPEVPTHIFVDNASDTYDTIFIDPNYFPNESNTSKILEEECLTIDKNYTNGSFIAYKVITNETTQLFGEENATYVFYSKGGYNYTAYWPHPDNVTYDDARFYEDVEIIEEIMRSIERK